MSNREFTAQRTMLANAFATAGAELLKYMGVSSALVAIPNTEPPRFVVAGTLAEVVKLLPAAEVIRPPVSAAEKPTGDLTDEQIGELWAMAIEQFQRHEAGVSVHPSIYLARAVERAAIAAHLERQAQQAERDESTSLDLHNAIMNLPCKRDDASFLNEASRQLYKEGHRDARHAAAELALAHVSQEGAHAARNAVLEEAALAAEKVQDVYRERQSGKWPELRDDAETGAGDCVAVIRGLKTPASAERSGDHE